MQTNSTGSGASETDREHPCAAIAVPASMADLVAGYDWARDAVGESGGCVYRLHGRADAPDLFLKHGRHAVADAITHEMVRLRWLAGRLPVPHVVQFTGTTEEAWLLMSAVPGKTAYQLLEDHPEDRIALVDAIAAFLRRVHAMPASECPFNSDHGYRLVEARARIDAGLVQEDDLDEEREGWTAKQIWQAMHDLLPLSPDPVVTHGDFSLDNILMCDGDVTGCIDVGRVGIADRYQDLAILWNCLGEFGPALQDRMLKRYGITRPDPAKLQFHLMLDELF